MFGHTGCNAHQASETNERVLCASGRVSGFASGWGWLATPLDCCISTLLTPARCTSLCISSTTTVQHFISLMHWCIRVWNTRHKASDYGGYNWNQFGSQRIGFFLDPTPDRILLNCNAVDWSAFKPLVWILDIWKTKYPKIHIYIFEPPGYIKNKTI